MKVAGLASDADQVRDAYVFVGSRKVFYMSNRKASEPKRLLLIPGGTHNNSMSLGGSQYRQAIDSLMKAKPQRVAGPSGNPGLAG